MNRAAIVGLVLAAAVIGAWAAAHVLAVFVIDWSGWRLMLAPLLIVVQAWLSVGLFIIAHDCMHGTLVPHRGWANRAVGQLCLGLYAGFSFTKLNTKHHEHHAHSGTADDPDFSTAEPPRFWPWYGKFILEYFGWREAVIIAVLFYGYAFITGANLLVLFMFWGLPAMLSSLQLFYFGTYLPHRPGTDAFTDRHRARSNEYSWLVSFLTCFHFGYHHEHHLYPYLPWWKLPDARPGRPLAKAPAQQAA